ncbi:hypothetical protein MOVS_05225 [Moraxella ovis]|uniref:Uncharacterized protein n=2 Tax=Moraxella ovis TaxID=29433 RepID=A0A378PKX8_9GAMM|nr:hypothetical protein MOVS_05225 [Moraxella ovis]STY87098.1 Uncharacterised protein [Moraxella ovis]
MGVFSSKIRVHGQSVSQRMTDDDSFIDSVKYATIAKKHYNLQNDKIDLNESVFNDTVRERIIQNIPNKFNKAYRMAEDTSKYIFGNPTTASVHKPEETLKRAVIRYLEDTTGKKVTLEYFYVGDKRHIHYAYDKLTKSYRYNLNTNKLVMYGKEATITSAVMHISPQTRKEYNDELFSVDTTWFDGSKTPNFTEGTRDELAVNYYTESTSEVVETPRLTVNTFLEGVITGYTQANAEVSITIDNTVTKITANNKGYFNHTFSGLNQDTAVVVISKNKHNRTSNRVTIQYPYINDNPATRGQLVKTAVNRTNGSFTLDLSDVNPITPDNIELPLENYIDYIQVMYKTTDGKALFTYGLGQGIESIDTALNVYSRKSKIYPRLYIRTDGVDLDKSKDTTKKNHTKALFKKVGIDLTQTTSDLTEALGGDYSKVHTMYISLSVGITDSYNDPILAEYLYRYFNNQIKYSVKTEYGYGRKDVHITDNHTNVVVSYARILKERVKGRVSEVGRYKANSEQLSYEKATSILSGKINQIRTSSRFVHNFMYQESDTHYIKISVFGLQVTQQYADRSENHNGDDENMAIPLDGLVTKGMSVKEKELLYNKALRVHILIRYTTKQRWYQRGVFKAVIAIIGIAITVITVGLDGGTGAMMAMAVIKSIAVGMAISIAIDLAVKLAVKLGWSSKLVTAIALVGAIVATYYSKGKSFKGFKAVDVMKILNTSFDVHNKAIQLKLIDFKKEYEAFMSDINDKYKKLKETQELLNTGVAKPEQELMLRPLSSYMYSSQVNLGESPETFYNRSMMYDVSELVMDMATNFVENSMYIPVQPYKIYEGEAVEDILLI